MSTEDATSEIGRLVGEEETPFVQVLQLDSNGKVPMLIKEHSLLCKALTQRQLKIGLLRAITSKAWSLQGIFEIHAFGSNTFILIFSSIRDKNWVLDKGPWCIMNSTLVFKTWPAGTKFADIDFTFSDIWIQVFDLPLTWSSWTNQQHLSSYFRSLIEVEVLPQQPPNVKCNLRLHVEFNVRDPLPAGCFLGGSLNEAIYYPFQYERIGEICYKCGRLGHIDNNCRFNGEVYNTELYGFWTRAVCNPMPAAISNSHDFSQSQTEHVHSASSFHSSAGDNYPVIILNGCSPPTWMHDNEGRMNPEFEYFADEVHFPHYTVHIERVDTTGDFDKQSSSATWVFDIDDHLCRLQEEDVWYKLIRENGSNHIPPILNMTREDYYRRSPLYRRARNRVKQRLESMIYETQFGDWSATLVGPLTNESLLNAVYNFNRTDGISVIINHIAPMGRGTIRGPIILHNLIPPEAS